MKNIKSASIGLGCVTFGREISKDTSFELMDHAWDMGIRSLDTAAAYSNGSSETIIGEWLADRNLIKGEINIATKILPPYSPSDIRASVEASLKRLGIEMIDLLYLHQWNERLLDHKSWLTLCDLVNEGKVAELGASNFNALQLKESVTLLRKISTIKLMCIQNNHNLAVSDLSDAMREFCIENSISIVTYSPLGAGFLTGKHLGGVQKNSRFEIAPAHQDVYFNVSAQRRLNKLLEVAKRTGYTPAFLALAWATHQPGVQTVLVGGRSVAHIDLGWEAIKFYSPKIFAELEVV